MSGLKIKRTKHTCEAMVDGKTNTETLHKPCDLTLPCTLVPRLLAMCLEKVLSFFPSSASGRPHLELDLPEIFSTSARRTLSIFIIISWMDFQKFPVSSSIWCSLSRPRILSPRPPRILIFCSRTMSCFHLICHVGLKMVNKGLNVFYHSCDMSLMSISSFLFQFQIFMPHL